MAVRCCNKIYASEKGKAETILYPIVEDRRSKPLSAKEWKDRNIEEKWHKIPLPLKSKKETEVFAVRVKEVISQAFYRPGAERWLIIEKLEKNKFKYYVSNAPVNTPLEVMVVWAHKRWEIEQGYQQLKEELGMDHFEGRSWGGLHRHITLCFMAYAFMLILRKQEGGKNQNKLTGYKGKAE